MQNQIEVVGFGAMNLDRLYRVERILIDGESPVLESHLLPGGSAANTIYALAKLGTRTAFVGAVGDDEEGRLLVGDLKSVGVDTSPIKVKKEAPSGGVTGLVDSKGRRSLYVQPGANSLLSDNDVALDVLHHARMLHVSSLIGEAGRCLQERIILSLPPAVWLSFAPGAIYASLGIETFAPILKRTHVLFINRHEARLLSGSSSYKQAAAELVRAGCAIVVVTLGKGTQAAYIAHCRGAVAIPARATLAQDVVDTTGAGDAFVAGFLFGLGRGEDYAACGRWGELMASLCITKMGGRAGLPTLPELSRLYREYYGDPL